MAVSAGIGFDLNDFSTLIQKAKEADKSLAGIVSKMQTLSNTRISGDIYQYLDRLIETSNLTEKMSKNPLKLDVDTSKLNNSRDALDKIIQSVWDIRELSNGAPLTFFDPQKLYATVEPVAVLADKLQKVTKEIESLDSQIVAKAAAKENTDDLAKKRAQKAEEEAILKRQVEFASKTKAEQVAIIEKAAAQELKIEQAKVNEIVKNQEQLLKKRKQLEAEHNRYVSAEAAGKELSKVEIRERNKVAKELREVNRKIRENYKAHQDILTKEADKGAQKRAETIKSLEGRAYTKDEALKYSQQTKSLNDMQRAIKILDETRKQENLTTAEGMQNYQRLTQELERQKNQYNQLTGGVRRETNRLTNGVFKGLSAVLGGVGQKFLAIFSLQQIRGYVNQLIAVRGEFELQQRSLQAILQNKKEADSLWQKTIDLSVKSPFKVKELVTYTKQLAAYRIEADKLYDTNKMLADISAGLGVDMSRLILAFGQVKTASYLRGTELRQFTEAGVPLLDELSKRFSELENRVVSIGEVFSMISKRQVYFEDVEAVLANMTKAGGVFYNMQEIQSETLKGMLMNLKDSVALMMNEIGSKTEGVMKGSIALAKNIVDNWKEVPRYITLAAVALGAFKLSSFLVSKYWLSLIHPISTITKGVALMGALATRFVATLKTWIANISMFVTKLKEAEFRQKVFNSTAAKNVYVVVFTIIIALLGKIILETIKLKNEQKELEKITFDGVQRASELSAKFKTLADTATDASQGIDKQNEALEEMKRTYEGLVPEHLLTIENLQKMEGNYNAVTRAIYAKIEAETREKKIEHIQSREGKEVEKYTNRLVKGLVRKGISSDAARTIVAKFREEFDAGKFNGLIEAKEALADFIGRYTDLEVLINKHPMDVINKDFEDYYLSLILFNREVAEVTEGGVGSPWIEKGGTKIYKELSQELKKAKETIGDWKKENEENLDLYMTIEVEEESKKAYINNLTDLSDSITKRVSLGVMDSIGSEMVASFKGNVDLLNRPIIDAAELAKKQWEDVGNGIATVFSSSFGIEDAKGNIREILVTPILPDGTVLSPQELEDYVNTQLQGARDFLKADKKGIVIAVDVTEGAGEKLHNLQEEYYNLKKETEGFEGVPIPVEDAVAAQNIISDIADEIKRIKIDDTTEEINAFRLEVSRLTGVDLGNLRTLVKREGDALGEYIKKVEEYLESYQETIKVFDDAAKAGEKVPFLQRLSLLGTKTLGQFKQEANAITMFLDRIRLSLKEEPEADWLAKQVADYVEAEGLFGINIEKLLSGEETVDAFFKRIQSELQSTETLIEQAENSGQLLFSWGSNEQGIVYLKKLRTELRFLLDQFGVAPLNEFNAFLVHSIQNFLALKGESYSFINIEDLSKNEQTIDEFFDGLQDKYKENEEKIKELQIASAQLYEGTSNEDKIKELQAANDALKDTLLTYGRWEEKEKGNGSRNSLYDERIKVIDDMRKKYEDLNKTLDESTSLRGAFESYIDAFATAYEGVSWIPKNVRQMTPEEFATKVLNFPDEDAIVEFFEMLSKEPMKAYEKIKVELAMGDYVLDAKVRIKQEDDEDIVKQVEEMFDQYDLSLELDKMGLSKDLVAGLFDVEYTSLDELRKGVESMRDKFVGTDMVKKWEGFLQKIGELEDKAAKERMKTYSQYLVEGMSERVKLKIEEMKKLKEIEESEEFTPEQKARITQGVEKETNKALQKQEWEDFKNSDMYTMVFDDLEHYGSKALNVLQEKLESLKGSLSDLDATEVKEIISQINKIEDVMIERNPFAYMKDLKKQLKSMKSEEEYQIDLFNAREQEAQAQDSINLIDTINAKKAIGKAVTDEEKAQYDQLVTAAAAQGIAEDKIRESKELEVKSAQKAGQEAQKGLNTYKQLRKTLEEQSKYWGDIGGKINDAFEASKEMMTALGVSTDSLAYSLVESAQGMSDLTIQAVQFGLKMKIIGYETNMALGVIGWIVIAVQTIAKIISAIVSAKNAKFREEIESHQRAIEKLQKSYEELEKKIDEAWSTAQMKAYQRELNKTYQQQLEKQKAIIAAYEDEKEIKDKKVKSDKYKEYEEEKAKLKELQDTFAETTENIFSKITDGILDDVLDATRGFVDAWYDAFVETGDGLKGLEENFDEMFLNIVKQQAALLVSDQFIKRWKEQLEKLADNEGGKKDNVYDLTVDEVKEWAKGVKEELPQLSEMIEPIFEGVKDFVGNGSGLTALEKGISGITESQAEVIESYLNSTRQYVAMNGEELRKQTSILNNIYSILNELTATMPNGSGFVGRGIKTIM